MEKIRVPSFCITKEQSVVLGMIILICKAHVYIYFNKWIPPGSLTLLQHEL